MKISDVTSLVALIVAVIALFKDRLPNVFSKKEEPRIQVSEFELDIETMGNDTTKIIPYFLIENRSKIGCEINGVSIFMM